MRLNELFDQPVEYRWITKQRKGKSLAQFEVDGDFYEFQVHYEASTMTDPPSYEFWQVDFGLARSSEMLGTGLGLEYGATGYGHGAVIMSTVAAILKDYKEFNPVPLQFSSGQTSRTKLYDAMLKRFGVTPVERQHYPEHESTHYTI